MYWVGGLVVSDGRAFISGVVDGLRYRTESYVRAYAHCRSADESLGKSAPRKSYREKRGRLKKERMVLALLQTRKTRMRWIISADGPFPADFVFSPPYTAHAICSLG